VTVLAAAVSAVLAGARTYVAIAEWAHDLPVSLRVLAQNRSSRAK
jgi:hypothetical protein